eukprot:CAMPEP_0169306016 /NCGR_PEP_ID=MMETSP1017-20121227/480_1 /TAXON_ID=342587 /ORGANISM="Karlodinium micrum, Strain CCMP2283" /LENGTH=52 /DNA_ID=CAMNT_0009399101 /DNA_START=49 /DNA_END=204 /DNA_ORIENTATION=-
MKTENKGSEVASNSAKTLLTDRTTTLTREAQMEGEAPGHRLQTALMVTLQRW